MRLHKFIAHAGVASRRAAEEMIRQGRVKVNGQTVKEMGVVVDPSRDSVRCDGRQLRLAARRHYLVLYKPKGVVSTLSDPQKRATVRDFLPPEAGRVYPVGRLDWDAEGVLIFTDDGELANRLAHPRHGVERTYHVKVRGEVDSRVLERLREGIGLPEGPVRPERVRVLRRRAGGVWLTLTLRQGRYHEVKRLCRAVGHPVQKLRRVSFAGLKLGALGPGQWRYLSAAEVRHLRRSAGE